MFKFLIKKKKVPTHKFTLFSGFFLPHSIKILLARGPAQIQPAVKHFLTTPTETDLFIFNTCSVTRSFLCVNT